MQLSGVGIFDRRVSGVRGAIFTKFDEDIELSSSLIQRSAEKA